MAQQQEESTRNKEAEADRAWQLPDFHINSDGDGGGDVAVLIIGIGVALFAAGYTGYAIGKLVGSKIKAGFNLARGHYAKTLGRGGSATVRTKKMPDNTSCAEKLFNKTNDNRFSNEVNFYKKLSQSKVTSDAIVKFLRAGRTPDGWDFIDLELMPDGSLDMNLNALGLHDAVSIAKDVAAGLQCIHSSINFVHRDIKPGNILVDLSSVPKRAKITDFGIAIQQGAKETGNQGTAHYIAPECRSADEVTASAAADMYSFGVVLFELLTEGLFLNRLPAQCSTNDLVEELLTLADRCRQLQPATRPPASECLASLRDLETKYFPSTNSKKRKRGGWKEYFCYPSKKHKPAAS